MSYHSQLQKLGINMRDSVIAHPTALTQRPSHEPHSPANSILGEIHTIWVGNIHSGTRHLNTSRLYRGRRFRGIREPILHCEEQLCFCQFQNLRCLCLCYKEMWRHEVLWYLFEMSLAYAPCSYVQSSC